MKTTIEINGRVYDARTGKLLSSAVNNQTSTSHMTGGSIDGVNKHRPMANINNMPSKHQAKPENFKTHIQPSYKSIDIKPAIKRTQKSTTLVRAAVKKPTKNGIKIHATSSNVDSNIEKSATGRGMLLKRVPSSRLARANNSTKSTLVHRFNSTVKIKPKLSHKMPVVNEPIVDNNDVAPPLYIGDTSNQHVFNHNNNYISNKVKNKKLSFKHITNAIGLKISSNRKFIIASSAVLLVLVFGCYMAYQKIPTVGMRVAASKAGFVGKYPSSTPAGYSFQGPIFANRGNIVLNFKSNSDNRTFTINQKPTDWTSESLLTNYLSQSKLRYQTYQDKGMTVYIFNESSATWVDKGIWYTVKGDGSLSSEQILEIASSI